MEGEAAGLGNATSSSLTDRLTREHKMTVDEAQLILNVKRDASLEDIVKVSILWLCYWLGRFLRLDDVRVS
jgi:hypothetical protein